MMATHPPKTLQMLIKEDWLVDSITNLGGGYFTHLSYQAADIDPKVLSDILHPDFRGVFGEIIKLRPQDNRRIAVVEVSKTNDFKAFIRFDLRLLEVVPYIKDYLVAIQPDYLCYYKL